jgi:hypothetical protein
VAALRCFGHRQIMPDLSSPETCIKPYKNRPRRLIDIPFLPTLKPEEPLLLNTFRAFGRFRRWYGSIYKPAEWPSITSEVVKSSFAFPPYRL